MIQKGNHQDNSQSSSSSSSVQNEGFKKQEIYFFCKTMEHFKTDCYKSRAMTNSKNKSKGKSLGFKRKPRPTLNEANLILEME